MPRSLFVRHCFLALPCLPCRATPRPAAPCWWSHVALLGTSSNGCANYRGGRPPYQGCHAIYGGAAQGPPLLSLGGTRNTSGRPSSGVHPSSVYPWGGLRGPPRLV